MQPVEIWRELISSETTEKEIQMRLQEIYRLNRPYNVEIVLNSYCPNKCKHCLYPPDYHLFNKNIRLSEWKSIFQILHDKYSFRNYIFNGRSINKDYLKILASLKNDYPDVTMGVVIEGNTEENHIEELIRISPNWIDVSVDGFTEEHDLQRDQKGAFNKTVNVLRKLRDSGTFEKISVLSCLTTINISSIIDMITFFNNEGFPNFFVTPISTVDGYRPDTKLRPSQDQLVYFIDEMLEKTSGLSDTWLEINLFEARYVQNVAQIRPEIFKNAALIYDHLEFMGSAGNNEIHICYYPSSLTGVREFIVNSNGDIIPPKVAAMGKIRNELVFGDVFKLDGTSGIFNNMVQKPAFSFFVNELIEEAKWLRDINMSQNS